MRVLPTPSPDDGTTLLLAPPQPDKASAFGRLVAIMLRNELLLTRCDKLRARQFRAAEYEVSPGADLELARLIQECTRSAYKDVVAELRANRAEALAILSDLRAGRAA